MQNNTSEVRLLSDSCIGRASGTHL